MRLSCYESSSSNRVIAGTTTPLVFDDGGLAGGGDGLFDINLNMSPSKSTTYKLPTASSPNEATLLTLPRFGVSWSDQKVSSLKPLAFGTSDQIRPLAKSAKK